MYPLQMYQLFDGPRQDVTLERDQEAPAEAHKLEKEHGRGTIYPCWPTRAAFAAAGS